MDTSKRKLLEKALNKSKPKMRTPTSNSESMLSLRSSRSSGLGTPNSGREQVVKVVRRDLAISDHKRKKQLQDSLSGLERDYDRYMRFELEMDKYDFLRKVKGIDLDVEFPIVDELRSVDLSS